MTWRDASSPRSAASRVPRSGGMVVITPEWRLLRASICGVRWLDVALKAGRSWWSDDPRQRVVSTGNRSWSRATHEHYWRMRALRGRRVGPSMLARSALRAGIAAWDIGGSNDMQAAVDRCAAG